VGAWFGKYLPHRAAGVGVDDAWGIIVALEPPLAEFFYLALVVVTTVAGRERLFHTYLINPRGCGTK
jgi:hypothetical protein